MASFPKHPLQLGWSAQMEGPGGREGGLPNGMHQNDHGQNASGTGKEANKARPGQALSRAYYDTRRLIFGYNGGPDQEEESSVEAATVVRQDLSSNSNSTGRNATHSISTAPCTTTAQSKQLILPQGEVCASSGQVALLVGLLCAFVWISWTVLVPQAVASSRSSSSNSGGSSSSRSIVEVFMELAFWIGECWQQGM